MQVPSVRDLIDRCPTVGSLPSVYNRLAEVMNDPYSSAADFGAVVSEDAGLTGRLLQLVNSAFYGFPSRMESVAQALAVVGTNQLHDLALATSVITVFEDIPPDMVDMESFWRHSLACGVAARTFAQERREPNVERLFVAGLLHDVGRLIMIIGFPEGVRTAFAQSREDNAPLYDVEMELFGYDHAQVGRALAENWKLPQSLQDPIGYHHNPSRATRYPSEAALVHLGDVTAHALGLGNSGERYVPAVSNVAWQKLADNLTVSLNMVNNIQQQYTAAVQAILQEN